jgi:hypothetical protein
LLFEESRRHVAARGSPLTLGKNHPQDHMKVFLFKPSNELLGKFSVEDIDQVAHELRKYAAQHPSIPAYSYVEASGRSWTIVCYEPFELKEGRIFPPAKIKEASPPLTPLEQQLELTKASKKAAKMNMLIGGLLCTGGITFTLLFMDDAQRRSREGGDGTYFIFWGAILWGALIFMKGALRMLLIPRIEPNKAVEPTTTSVMPRANERRTE